jgi:stage III sporulation protein AG
LKSLKEIFASSGLWKVGLLFALGLVLIAFGTGYTNNDNESLPTSVDALENRLADLCSSVEGVGECRILITYEEEREGYSSKTVSVISGIAVVCEGGDLPQVKSRVTELITSIFGIGANRVRIEKLKK